MKRRDAGPPAAAFAPRIARRRRRDAERGARVVGVQPERVRAPYEYFDTDQIEKLVGPRAAPQRPPDS
jgi:hypothetical protein